MIATTLTINFVPVEEAELKEDQEYWITDGRNTGIAMYLDKQRGFVDIIGFVGTITMCAPYVEPEVKQ